MTAQKIQKRHKETVKSVFEKWTPTHVDLAKWLVKIFLLLFDSEDCSENGNRKRSEDYLGADILTPDEIKWYINREQRPNY